MSQWGTSDSGILRKNKADENLDQLLVFGYSCKVFRDDEKALYIDQGKHLIPWMGDETLKIDRYDGRGALSDLRQYEASKEGYDTLRWMGLSESEKRWEELCDSERYYSLEINEEEEEMYKEEVAKRQKTNAIGFNYENPGASPEIETKDGIPTVAEKEEEDEPYKPSPVLDVPINIDIPRTVKKYASIEKTALFVCRQGPQMEILIKAKQADNPQFSFLTVNDPLYKFYRHVLSAFKNGRYQPQCEKKQDEPQTPQTPQDDDQDTHYLHPSLLSAGSAKPDVPPLPKNPPIPSVPYRPSADCTYSQLVNRIQGTGINSAGQIEQQNVAAQGAVINPQGASIGQTGGMTAEVLMNLEQQYHHYYYVQQFYEYWRHAVLSGEQGALYANLPTDFSQLDPNMQSYIHQMAWTQFVQHYQKQMQDNQEVRTKVGSNSYAQIVFNLNKDVVNPYTANVPQLPPLDPNQEEPKPVLTEVRPEEERTVTIVKPKEENKVKKPLLSLAAAYGSGTESDSDSSDSESNSDEERDNKTEEQIEVYRVPSGETRTVIDKMAEYVFKNGAPFEEIIREKGDPRFDFLNDGHEFKKYYRAKLRELKGEQEAKEVKKEIEKKPPKPKKIIAPVSFSIKKTKEDPPKEIKSALPIEDSSDEEEGYLDKHPKSPQNNAETKAATNGNVATAQKVPIPPKIGPMIYRIATHVLPQAKVGRLSPKNEEEKYKSDLSKRLSSVHLETAAKSLKGRSVSPTSSHRRNKRDSSSPRRRSRSPSNKSSRRSHTPKKRPHSPRKSSISPKRSKSRSKTPGKKSPTRKRRTPTRNKLTPIKEKRTITKNKKKQVIDMFEDDEKSTGGDKGMNGLLVGDDPILEMLELETEEKTAEERSADAKEKARQLERKRKAAMFLKLKSAESSVQAAPSAALGKNEKSSSPDKSEKSSPVKSERSSKSRVGSPLSSTMGSRRTSDDSVKIVSSRKSRSRSRERTKLKDKSVSRDKSRSRSKSKESNPSTRRSRSKEKKKHSKKRKRSKEKDRSGSRSKDDDRKMKKEKKKKSNKRKHSKSKDHDSKSKKKSKKHKRSRSPSKIRSVSRTKSPSKLSRSTSKSRSKSRSRSKIRSRSRSVQSHISIDSS